MKNMLPLIVAAVVGIASVAHAVPKRAFPSQKDGSAVAHPDYGGYSYFTERNTTDSLVCSGKCLLVGFYRSTGAAGSGVELRDTDVAGSTDDNLLMYPISYFGPSETDYLGGGMLPRPILATKGIAVTVQSISNQEHVTVVYIDLDD